MFNSGIKTNQRCNGIVPTKLIEKNGKSKTLSQTNYINILNSLGSATVKQEAALKFNSSVGKHIDVKPPKNHVINIHPYSSPHGAKYTNDIKVKVEPVEQDYDDKTSTHSIIGLSEDVRQHKIPALVKQRFKRGIIRATHHETLQRIDTLQDVYNHYQQHWFSASLEKLKMEDRSREERIEITRHEFRRHLHQIIRSQIGVPNKLPPVPVSNLIPRKNISLLRNNNSKYLTGYNKLVARKTCEVDDCGQPALPCTHHCTLHIMFNTEQVLFDYCTAKFADNTQCSVPVFDITHELPLCPEHARKRDNYKLNQETKPKKLRKKVKPSAMIRPQKRNKKKKKSIRAAPSAIIPVVTALEVTEVKSEAPELTADMEIVEQVLSLNEPELVLNEQELETQATHLLEETELSNVLSTIQVDEFSDFFSVNRNGEYEPTREEAEELEKALAAVDNDVKSLEKLSQSQGLLDSLLDEHSLAESLVQIPDVFHNGYTPSCGDNMVAQTSSFLLPVEPHSHS